MAEFRAATFASTALCVDAFTTVFGIVESEVPLLVTRAETP